VLNIQLNQSGTCNFPILYTKNSFSFRKSQGCRCQRLVDTIILIIFYLFSITGWWARFPCFNCIVLLHLSFSIFVQASTFPWYPIPLRGVRGNERAPLLPYACAYRAYDRQLQERCGYRDEHSHASRREYDARRVQKPTTKVNKSKPKYTCARREKDIQHWDLHPVLHNPNDHEPRQSERDYDHAFLQHVCDCPCNRFHDRRRDHQQIHHWSWWCKYKVTTSHFCKNITVESLCLPFGVTMVVSMIGRHVGNCYRCTLELK